MVPVSNLVLSSKFKFTGLGRLLFWHKNEMKARHLPVRYGIFCPVAAASWGPVGVPAAPHPPTHTAKEKGHFLE